MAIEYLGALHTGVQLVKDAQSIYREWKAAKGGAPEELEQKLEQAEQQLKLAEVAVARDLGYRICKRHWPPGIMLEEQGSQWRCSDCSSVEQTFWVV